MPLVGGIAKYDPTDNRARTSLPSFARKGARFADKPDLTDGKVFQDEWVAYLVSKFGTAASGGVRFYVVDNEPDLWSETHTDVRPAQTGYDDMLANFREYAAAIKDVDPSAYVMGPAISGWTGYLYSPLDRGTDAFKTSADRKAHGNIPYLPWFLDQMHKSDAAEGRRTLDVLDIHYYPQGRNVYQGATDEATNALRLRQTRSLWDPSYSDESWIKEPVRLIPRLREWIDRFYPGTQLAIGEWNWGAEKTMNGAVAIADVLGIYGREGVDLACYWTAPPKGSPGALAFSMYTNYDGQGSGFGDTVLKATSDAPVDDIAVYASKDSSTGSMVLMLINKRSDAELPTDIDLAGWTGDTSVSAYRLAGAAPTAIQPLTGVTASSGKLSVRLPASSITLLRVGE
jgi:hypothetical protein